MNKTIVTSLIILVMIVGVTAYLNRGNIADRQEMQDNAQIILLENGEEIKTVDMTFIKKQGEKTFNKELDTSETGPELQTYTGVLLKSVIEEAGIKLDNKTQVIVKAVDGYTVALTAVEVRKNDNVYIVYKNNGQYLQEKSKGGTGPYRIVIRDDQFGQRWCKFVMEVNIK